MNALINFVTSDLGKVPFVIANVFVVPLLLFIYAYKRIPSCRKCGKKQLFFRRAANETGKKDVISTCLKCGDIRVMAG